jgi:hypothetical protein
MGRRGKEKRRGRVGIVRPLSRAEIARVRHDALYEAVRALMDAGHTEAALVVSRLLPHLPCGIERDAKGKPTRMVWRASR